jgi:hypothetical protein
MAIKSMNTRVDFVGYLPQNLTGVNFPTQTLANEAVTGLQISTGAAQGKRFYVSEYYANQLSTATQQCHEGWYRIVQVAATAVAANIYFGAVGAQQSVANGPDVVTDASTVLTLAADPVVFLGPVTPGNFTIVQDAGTASLMVGNTQTVAVGTVLSSTAAGTVAVTAAPTTTAILEGIVAVALAAITTPAALTLSAAAAQSAGSQVLTGTITGGGSNAFAGQYAVVTGFDLTANNGTFLITASTTTTLTVNNPAGVADTHAATATLQGLVIARFQPIFGE